jgi:hypothetical protein
VHLFLIPIEQAICDSQMIFVLWKHTPFAAGAKLCDTAKKLITSRRKMTVGPGPSFGGQRSRQHRRDE